MSYQKFFIMMLKNKESIRISKMKKLLGILVNKMKEISKSKGWNLVRWITRDDNVRAKSLYDRVSKKTNWDVYELK